MAETSGSDAPRVSVIIPHLDDLAGLATCMAALERQTLPRADFEIVVGDNGSRAGCDAVAAAAAGAHVVAVAEKGAGPARNGAVAASRGRVLAFTDSDCLPDPGWLAEALDALEGADLVGGAMRVTAADPAHRTPAEAFELVFAFDNRTNVLKRGFSVTANLVTSRAVFEATGPFRNGVSEDVEWCHRARARGFRIAYAERALVAHPARRSFAELTRKWRRVTREKVLLDRDAGLPVAAQLLRAAVIAASPVVHSVRIARAGGLGVADKLAALGVLVRLRLLRAWWTAIHLCETPARRS
ncbi:MAG: glycosyltransferase [Hyphomicrobiaceae bacterium]